MEYINKRKLCLEAVILSLTATLLSACASNPAHQTFAPATEVVTKTVTVPMQTQPEIDASYSYETNPALIKAYEDYQKTGKAANVSTQGFEGFAYDPGRQVYIACEPLRICTILLQQGEQIKGLSLSDTANWDMQALTVGGSQLNNSAKLLVIKPKANNISANLVITTDKRIYNIALTTSDKYYVRQAVFYYPMDTNKLIESDAQQAIQQQQQQDQNVVASMNNGTNINLSNINFNYQISGDSPVWKPVRVFDDGTHTIIQFSSAVNSSSLPALFLLSNGQDQIVNFRKKVESNGTVDYVVDQVFSQAVLTSGVGSDQTKVVITNRALDKSWF